MLTGGLALGLRWRLRRVAADLRQQDVARRVGISTTRYSAIERGEQEPTALERSLVERVLPELPIRTEVS
jgi:transcriptional regulator with XRE-family HTH domain